MDFVESCLDEIALEGLDGITLPALWVRLAARKPKFPLPLDEHTKEYLWKNVVCPSEDVEFYLLKEPRNPLVLFDRFQFCDDNTGIVLEQEQREDLYPHVVIDDVENDVMGSCSTYKTRKNISNKIRDEDLLPLLSCAHTIDKYGESLVIVASQETRQFALLGSEKINVIATLTSRCYAFLERIGRARWFGEITQGNNSLRILGIDPKSLFYVRKQLLIHKLITSQIFNTRLISLQNTTGTLVQLKRFYTPHAPIYMSWLIQLSDLLEKKPNQREILIRLRDELRLTNAFFKRLLGTSVTLGVTQTVWLSQIEADPAAPVKKPRKDSPGPSRLVRVVELIKPYVYRQEDNEEVVKDDEEEDLEDKEDLQVPILRMDKTIIRQVIEFVRVRGGRGVSEVELTRGFGVSKLCGRTLARYLERSGIAKKILFDRGKQRVYRYVATELKDSCKLLNQMQTEREKIDKKIQNKTVPINLDSTLDESSASLNTSQLDTTLNETRGDQSVTDISTSKDQSDTTVVENPSAASANTEYSFGKLGENLVHFTKCKDVIKSDGILTYRWLKRANIILELLEDVHIVDQTIMMQKKIMECEAKEEGVVGKPDKKSIMRILKKLEKMKEIKIHSTIIQYGDKSKELMMFCHKSMERECSELKVFIECQRQKLQAITMRENLEKTAGSATKIKIKKEPKESRDGEDEPEEVENCGENEILVRDSGKLNYGLLKGTPSNKHHAYDSKAGTTYGYKPKCRKMEILHKYLWYLIYGFDIDKPQPKDDLTLLEDTMCFPSCVTENTASENDEDPIPDQELQSFRVYKDEESWKRFLPRIPKRKGFPEGWFMVGDIVLVMPVSIFLSIVRTNYKIPGMVKVLKDPIRRHVTISQLPNSMRMALMHDRRYLFAITEMLQTLAFSGLTACGSRDNKEKHQVMTYLYKHATIVDTIDLNPPKELRTKHYCLDSYKALLEFWFDLQYTAINTPLVNISEVDVSKNRSAAFVMERFGTLLNMNKEDVNDVPGRTLPGDGRGAAGCDSFLFLHLRRNWSWNTDSKAPQVDSTRAVSRIAQEHMSAKGKTGIKLTGKLAIKLKSSIVLSSKARKIKKVSSADVHNKTRKVKKILVEGKPKKGGLGMKRKPVTEPEDKDQPEEDKTPTPKKRRKRLRTREDRLLKAATIPKKKPTVDERDQAILSRKKRDRTDWNTEEDSMLLLAEVTQRFLIYPDTRRDVLVSSFFLRDLMHDQMDSFADKTSKAVSRRIKYIMKNKETKTNVHVFVGEALQDEELVNKYKKGKCYTKSLPPQMLQEAYKEVYYKLKEKFSASAEEENAVVSKVPDTLAELESTYTIRPHEVPDLVRWRPIHSKEDICFWVLHNVVHCAMLLHDKIGRSHELFKLFSQYPEELLVAVFKCMRTDTLITKLKKNQANKTLPWNKIMLSSPRLGGYQVSQRYMYHWFTKTYPRDIFEEAPRFINQLHEPQPSGTGTCPVVMTDQGGYAAVCISLSAQRLIRFETMIPDRIITVVGTDLTSKHARASQSKQAREHTKKASSKEDELEDELIAQAEEAERKKEQEKKERERKTSEANTEGNVEIVGDDGKEKSGEASEKGDKETAGLHADTEVTFQGSRSTSRSYLSMMHKSQYDVPENQVYQMDNNLVVNGCSVRICLKQPPVPPPDIPAAGILHTLQYLKEYNRSHPWIHPKTAHYVLKFIRATLPLTMNVTTTLKNISKTSSYTASGLQDLYKICDQLRDKEHFGMTLPELKERNLGMANLEKHITILREHNVVLRVGVVEFRYVLYEFARPWLTHTFKQKKEGFITDSTPAKAAVDEETEGDVVDLGAELPLPAYYPDFNGLPRSKNESVYKAQTDDQTGGTASGEEKKDGQAFSRAELLKNLHETAQQSISKKAALARPYNSQLTSGPEFKAMLSAQERQEDGDLAVNAFSDYMQKKPSDDVTEGKDRDQDRVTYPFKPKYANEMWQTQQLFQTDSSSMIVFPNLGYKKEEPKKDVEENQEGTSDDKSASPEKEKSIPEIPAKDKEIEISAENKNQSNEPIREKLSTEKEVEISTENKNHGKKSTPEKPSNENIKISKENKSQRKKSVPKKPTKNKEIESRQDVENQSKTSIPEEPTEPTENKEGDTSDVNQSEATKSPGNTAKMVIDAEEQRAIMEQVDAILALNPYSGVNLDPFNMMNKEIPQALNLNSRGDSSLENAAVELAASVDSSGEDEPPDLSIYSDNDDVEDSSVNETKNRPITQARSEIRNDNAGSNEPVQSKQNIMIQERVDSMQDTNATIRNYGSDQTASDIKSQITDITTDITKKETLGQPSQNEINQVSNISQSHYRDITSDKTTSDTTGHVLVKRESDDAPEELDVLIQRAREALERQERVAATKLSANNQAGVNLQMITDANTLGATSSYSVDQLLPSALSFNQNTFETTQSDVHILQAPGVYFTGPPSVVRVQGHEDGGQFEGPELHVMQPMQPVQLISQAPESSYTTLAPAQPMPSTEQPGILTQDNITGVASAWDASCGTLQQLKAADNQHVASERITTMTHLPHSAETSVHAPHSTGTSAYAPNSTRNSAHASHSAETSALAFQSAGTSVHAPQTAGASAQVAVESKKYEDKDCTDITVTPSARPGERARAMLKPGCVSKLVKRKLTEKLTQQYVPPKQLRLDTSTHQLPVSKQQEGPFFTKFLLKNMPHSSAVKSSAFPLTPYVGPTTSTHSHAGHGGVPMIPRIAPASLVQGQKGPIMTTLPIQFTKTPQSGARTPQSSMAAVKQHKSPVLSPPPAKYSNTSFEISNVPKKDKGKRPKKDKVKIENRPDDKPSSALSPTQPIVLNVGHSIVKSMETDTSASDDEEASRRRIAEFLRKSRAAKKVKKVTPISENQKSSSDTDTAHEMTSPSASRTTPSSADKYTTIKDPNAALGPPELKAVSPTRSYTVKNTPPRLEKEPPLIPPSPLFVVSKFDVVVASPFQNTKAPSLQINPVPKEPKTKTPRDPKEFEKSMKSLIDISGNLQVPIKIQLPPRISIPLPKEKVKVMDQDQAITAGILEPSRTTVVESGNPKIKGYKTILRPPTQPPKGGGTKRKRTELPTPIYVSQSLDMTTGQNVRSQPRPRISGPNTVTTLSQNKPSTSGWNLKNFNMKSHMPSRAPNVKFNVESSDEEAPLITISPPETPELKVKYEENLDEIKKEYIGNRNKRMYHVTEEIEVSDDDEPPPHGGITKRDENVLKILANYRVKYGTASVKTESSNDADQNIPQTDGPADEKIPVSSSHVTSSNVKSSNVTSSTVTSSNVTSSQATSYHVSSQSTGVKVAHETKASSLDKSSIVSKDKAKVSSDEFAGSVPPVKKKKTDVKAAGETGEGTSSACSGEAAINVEKSDTGKEGNGSGDKKDRPGTSTNFGSFDDSRPTSTSTADARERVTVEKVITLPRPWKTPEGSVNRPVLRMMMAGVLMHIMTSPGVTMEGLINKYNLILQPVTLKDLLEILEIVGCISKQKISLGEHKDSLFTRRQKYPQVSAEKTTIYKPTLDCVMKLGQFESQII